MNYNLAASWLVLVAVFTCIFYCLGIPDRRRRNAACRAYRAAAREDAANEALWALDEGRAYANDLLRSRALLVVTSGDDYGYAAKANYAEVLRIAAASDSPFPYFDAVCEVSARIETQNDPEWRAL